MPQMISRSDLARLHLDLQVPSLLSDVLEMQALLSAREALLLRNIFTDLSPLDTLLSLACCFQILIPHLGSDVDLIAPLSTQADYILDDYAPHWMKNSIPISAEWSEFVRDDLDNLADFLIIMADAAVSAHPAVAQICEILKEQACLKSLAPVSASDEILQENVIRFPIERRV